MTISVPELSLILLVGPSGSGKSTFARTHFASTEIISSDYCRGLVSDDENDQAATGYAFELLHAIVDRRLAYGRLTVVDATNVQPESRRSLIDLAARRYVRATAIILDLPERLCRERNASRPDRQFGPHVIRNQRSQLRRGLASIGREGFARVHHLQDERTIESVKIERTRLRCDMRHESGPFDFIGDVHGCCSELELLLVELGYQRQPSDDVALTRYPDTWSHASGRRAVFVGDLADRGPRVLDAFGLVRNMCAAGSALCVPGNHDVKLMRLLHGKKVQVKHGLATTVAELDGIPEEEVVAFKEGLAAFIDSLVEHLVLDGGGVVVAHAGLQESMQGRSSGRVTAFALFGDTTGESDELGLPVRLDWGASYRGKAAVVYGHTPVADAEWLNKTINIDTGCVFGGRLTALRWPERELVSVAALAHYAESPRPIVPREPDRPTAQQEDDAILDIDDVTGKRIVQTRLVPSITIQGENSIAALEVMSRFAIDPRWLIYLPPTMSPTESTREEGRLEHPNEAFAYYRNNGIERVICQEKHMGSRAVIVVCRSAESARIRFGDIGDEQGVCYTRTGRRFFRDETIEQALIARIASAITDAGLWEEFETDWFCLDCELMPWSVKAQELLQHQYASVGAAAEASMAATNETLETALASGADVAELLTHYRERSERIVGYRRAYRNYCWSVSGLNDLKLAPFHILASEGTVHTDKDHLWHLSTIARMVPGFSEVLIATNHRLVDLSEPESVADGVAWWSELTGSGGEGMVVKPMNFIAHGPDGLLQPAVKCRGAEYLRIIYGPEYDAPEHLKRLRSRSVGRKRSLATREFALGVESLERFVQSEPLRRVHEPVFAVLALESEGVDPRL